MNPSAVLASIANIFTAAQTMPNPLTLSGFVAGTSTSANMITATNAVIFNGTSYSGSQNSLCKWTLYNTAGSTVDIVQIAADGTLQLLQSTQGIFFKGSGAGRTFLTVSITGASDKTLTMPNVAGTFLTTGTAKNSASSAAPTGTNSASAVMMAIGGAITPTTSTKLMIIASGQFSNATINDGATVDLRIGTGTAPINGAALSGTLVGISQTVTSGVAAEVSGFCLTGIATVVVGTAYWVDISLLAVTGGTASATGVMITAIEV